MKARVYNNPMNDAKSAEKERRRILESFDKQKITDYLTNVLHMKQIDGEINFWAAVCKAICSDPLSSPDKRKQAEKWLHDHGMSTGADDDNIPEIGKQLIKEPIRFIFGEPVESYTYGDLRIARTCGLGNSPVKKLVIFL